MISKRGLHKTSRHSAGFGWAKWLVCLLASLITVQCSLLPQSQNQPLPAATPGQFAEQRPQNAYPPNIIELDPATNVQFYLAEGLVQSFPLPDSSVSTRMVLVPGGEFIMGLNDEDPLGIQPAGHVRVAVNSFWLDQNEVTNKQYRTFLASLSPGERREMTPDSIAWAKEVGVPWNIYFRDESFDDYPVVCVTWHQAKKFAEWAGKRLPTEAEWEYAARSGVSGRIYPWEGIYSRDPRTGESLANFAPDGDYALDGFVITSRVASFKPNNFRLFDMAGNAAEWCNDAYFPSYKILKNTIKQLITPTYNNVNEPRKIVRGGSWASDEFFIGAGVRDYRFSKFASARIGFRMAKDADNPLVQARARQGNLIRNQQVVNPNVIQFQMQQNNAAAQGQRGTQVGNQGAQQQTGGQAQQEQPKKKKRGGLLGRFKRKKKKDPAPADTTQFDDDQTGGNRPL